jgi:hypothetical protein
MHRTCVDGWALCPLRPQVDFINAYTKLTLLGAKVDPLAYLYPEATQRLRF